MMCYEVTVFLAEPSRSVTNTFSQIFCIHIFSNLMHLDERNDSLNKIIRSNSESVTSRNEKEAKTWPRP